MESPRLHLSGEKYPWLIVLSLLALFIIPLIDLLEVTLNDFSFYLSESLLFGLYWWLFIPGLLFLFTNQHVPQSKLYWVILPTIALFHISLFGIMVHIISALFMGYTYTANKVIPYAITEHGISSLLVYGVTYFFTSHKSYFPKPQAAPLKQQITVSHRGQMIMLNLTDILYLAAEKPYIAVYTKEKKYLLKRSLKSFLENEAAEEFIQIHRSSIINTSYIRSFRSRRNGDFDIMLTNGQELRASRHYRKNFQFLLQASTSST